MSRILAVVILAALFLAPTGCASLQTQQQEPFAGYPSQIDRFDFKVAWRTSKTKEGLAVDVVLKNVRYLLVNDMTLEVSLQGKGQKVLSKGSDYRLQDLRDGEYANLHVFLKDASVSSGDQLHFQIRYNGIEGSVAHNIVSDFTVNAITGVIIRDKREFEQ
ncbi:MAG TPA: hypothetical protein DCZ75_15885 [Geobacter sp.]|nr:hypothetical protein [Geobacter sp.]